MRQGNWELMSCSVHSLYITHRYYNTKLMRKNLVREIQFLTLKSNAAPPYSGKCSEVEKEVESEVKFLSKSFSSLSSGFIRYFSISVKD